MDCRPRKACLSMDTCLLEGKFMEILDICVAMEEEISNLVEENEQELRETQGTNSLDTVSLHQYVPNKNE